MVLKLIGALTSEECTSIEIHNGNPDYNGLPGYCVTVHGLAEDLQMISEDFRADSILGCLLLAAEKKDPKLLAWFGPLDVYFYQGMPVVLEKPMIDIRAPLARVYWITDGAVGTAEIPLRDLRLAEHISQR